MNENQNETKMFLLLIYSGQKDMVEYLISRGANVSLGYKDGMTPLHCAILKGILNKNKIMRKSLNQSDCNAFLGDVEIANVLIENCAPVNWQTKADGRTPLHLAVMNGNVKEPQTKYQLKWKSI